MKKLIWMEIGVVAYFWLWLGLVGISIGYEILWPENIFPIFLFLLIIPASLALTERARLEITISVAGSAKAMVKSFNGLGVEFESIDFSHFLLQLASYLFTKLFLFHLILIQAKQKRTLGFLILKK